MKKFRLVISLIAVLSLGGGLAAQDASPQAPTGETVAKVSQFGRYSGYSPVMYDSGIRTSQYLTMRDGTRIAIDVIRPAKDGKVAVERLPVIWTHNRYRRAFTVNGRLISIGDSPDIQALIKRGYVAASADVRGSGASFGRTLGIFTAEESQDAYEITEWLARQPWSNGKIGMFGGSYLGITQLMAAGRKPPHLKAIFPVVSLFDLYSIGARGGVLKDDFLRTWSALIRTLDLDQIAAPVDDDKSGALLKKAIEEHKGNRSLFEAMVPLKFRDGRDPLTGAVPNLDWQPAGHIKDINDSGVPMYLWCGWFDAFTRDGFLMFRNFSAPKKLTIGAWSHAPKDPAVVKEEFTLLAYEEMRWFDFWLKGIDNGIMAEPPITYQVMVAPGRNVWKTARQWPIPAARDVVLYFQAGRTDSVASVNDGRLVSQSPVRDSAEDAYKIDYSTTTGTTTRWDNTVGGGFGYPDLAGNDAKGLTYTTAPLKAEVEVTGHPVVRIWASAAAPDVDVFAYLEEVEPSGVSHYVTEGVLRASHRAVAEPPYDNLGLPYHRSYEADVAAPAPGEPFELRFDLEPTSTVFDKGNRIRLTIACADKDNAATPVLSPAPEITVYRDKLRPSSITLPVPGGRFETAGVGATALILIMALVLVLAILIIAFAMFLRSKMKTIGQG
jgi:putative CocE/NonD family hydrolase